MAHKFAEIAFTRTVNEKELVDCVHVTFDLSRELS